MIKRISAVKAFLTCALIFAAFGFPNASAAEDTNQVFEPVHPSFIAPYVDHGIEDPDFHAFRNRLLEAVRARNVDEIVSLAKPDILLERSWDDGKHVTGVDRFRMNLEGVVDGVPLPQTVTEDYWRELERVLTLGGEFNLSGEKTVFEAPYSPWPFPNAGFNFEMYGYNVKAFDEFHDLSVISKNARLYSAPNDGATTENKLYFGEAVFLLSDLPTAAAPPEYLKILRTNGQVGYARETDVRQWYNFHAFFHKINGEWKLAVFAHDY